MAELYSTMTSLMASGWINESSHSATAEIEPNNDSQKVRLQPTLDGTARITQRVAVEANTQYQLSGTIFSGGIHMDILASKGLTASGP